MLPIWTTEISVTNQRLVVKRGFLTRRTEELALRAIEEVDFEQGVLGQLFGFGRIAVHGTGVDDMKIPANADPLAFRKAVQRAMSRLRMHDRVTELAT
jgi:uncharacterized membrane protein YdbT with pleckstrin-like domain